MVTPAPILHDISPPVSARTPVWPGDTPVSREVLSQVDDGDSVTLSTLHGTVHVGAHADAPSHVVSGTASIDAVALAPYIGPCRVLTARVPASGLIGPDDVDHAPVDDPTAARVLIRTVAVDGAAADFDSEFAALDPALVDRLGTEGAVLIGVDTPSVDPVTSKDLPAHRSCIGAGIAILEGLDLRDVPDGAYELIALPLRLVGFDASPVRAVLRALPESMDA
ncbi:MAG: cyclase family protein [Acidimicrobiales bacterium]